MISKLAQATQWVKSQSYFDVDEEEATYVICSTRRNGDMMHDCPGDEDMKEAYRMKKIIEEAFPEIKVEVEYVDEWSMITLTERN